MQALINKVEELNDNSQHTEAADLVARELGISFNINSSKFDSMQGDKDGQKRWIVNIDLVRGKKKYNFDYGTSVFDSCVKESEWDSLEDDALIEIYAGVCVKDKTNIHGSVKFNFRKSQFDDHKSSFIEARAKEMSDDYTNNITKYNEEINAKYEEGGISRIVRDTKFVNSTLTPDEAVVFINKAIKNKRDELQKNMNFSKTKSLRHSKMPSMYDVLTAMTKNDPGTFEDFCGDFGYDEDSRSAEKTYKAIKKEWNVLKLMFTWEEFEVLQYIQ